MWQDGCINNNYWTYNKDVCNDTMKEEKTFANIVHNIMVLIEDCKSNKSDYGLMHDLA